MKYSDYEFWTVWEEIRVCSPTIFYQQWTEKITMLSTDKQILYTTLDSEYDHDNLGNAEQCNKISLGRQSQLKTRNSYSPGMVSLFRAIF